MRPKKKNNALFELLSNIAMVVLFIAITTWGIQITNATTNGLKFVQLSDVHYAEKGMNLAYRMTKETPKLLDDAIAQTNNISGIDFVMFTGDLINIPLEKELKSVMKHVTNLKAPWYFAFGNHDTCVGGFLDKKLYIQILKNNNKNFKFDKPYYSFTPKNGYKVIVLDTIMPDKITANGKIDKEQLKWLESELELTNNSAILIFTHVPIIEPFKSPTHKLLNSDEVYNLLKSQNKPIAIFSGHYHTTKAEQDGKLLFVTSPALVSYPNSFRIVNVKNLKDKVVVDFEIKETIYKEVQKQSKMMTFSSDLYYGKDEDRKYTYELER